MNTIGKIIPHEEALLPETTFAESRIIILIVEDNEFENAIIKKQIQLLLDSGRMPSDFEIELISYMDGRGCMNDLRAGVFEKSVIIAFLDYYLQKGITGFDLFRVINSLNAANKSIFMTQSNEYKLWVRLSKTKAYALIHKDELTPLKCRDLLEKIFSEMF